VGRHCRILEARSASGFLKVAGVTQNGQHEVGLHLSQFLQLELKLGELAKVLLALLGRENYRARLRVVRLSFLHLRRQIRLLGCRAHG
jgi:hypothetical protein